MNITLRQLLVSKYGLHVIFWAAQVLSDGLAEMTIYDNNHSIYFLNLLSLHGLQIFICCFNVFVLIPRLFRSGKKIAYWIIVLSLVAGYSYSISRLQGYLFSDYFSSSSTLSRSLYHFALNTFSITRFLLITVLIALAREWLLKTFREKEQKAEQAKSEIQFLRSQLNPHLLLNTLNNIYGLVLTRSPQATEIILKLSDIMKYILYESTQDRVLLKKDVENVLNYIELEKLRQGNDASIEMQIDYGNGDQLVAPLLFLPLVENAFKHGINNKIKDACFYFSLQVDGSTITIYVRNNKVAPSRSTFEEHSGIGLHNLRRRLSLFYPGKHSLEIDETGTDFNVKLILQT